MPFHCNQRYGRTVKTACRKRTGNCSERELHVPLHLHTHDSTGNGVSTVLMAAEAGVDIVRSGH